MKRENGFTLVELLVSIAITLVVGAAAMTAFIQAQKVTTEVGLEANMVQNLRAGMHFLVRDLTQAGEGIPPAGISLPNTAAGVSAIVRPGTPVAAIFEDSEVPPVPYTSLAPVIPGSGLGSVVRTVNPANQAVLTGGFNTDMITILYADNTLVDSSASLNKLNQYPVAQAAPAAPVCGGNIAATGLTVTMAANCFTMPGGGQGTTPVSVGNLIMFQNVNGTALEYVTGVLGQVITFAAGDPAGLNQTGLPNGTVANLGVAATPTTITRIWMVTYYVNSVTNASLPQMMRQVNYPNFPAAAPVNPPQAVGEVIENLSFSYDIVNSTDPAGTYGVSGAGDAKTAIAPDTPFLFRAVNASIFGRSEYPSYAQFSPQYLRTSMSTQVSIRSMSFGLLFPTPGILP